MVEAAIGIFLKKPQKGPRWENQKYPPPWKKRKAVRIGIFGDPSRSDWVEAFFAYFWLAYIFLKAGKYAVKLGLFLQRVFGFRA